MTPASNSSGGHIPPEWDSTPPDDPTSISVLAVIRGLGVGGAEKLLLAQAETAPQLGIDLTVAYLHPGHSRLRPEFEHTGTSVVCLDGGNPFDFRWVARLRQLVLDTRPDVVHLHSPSVAALARPTLWHMGSASPAIVYTEHNAWDAYSSLTRHGNRLSFSMTDADLVVSEHALASMDPDLARDVEVLTHGIALDHLSMLDDERRTEVRADLGIEPHHVLCGMVANHRPEKDHATFLRAARRAVELHPEIRFIAIGDGPLRRQVDQLHAQLGLEQVVQILGFRDDVAELLGALDLFVLSSVQEGLPVALMEAMAMGVPVVSTRVGGVPEAVRDGVEGWLVPPESPRDLADVLAAAAGDPAERALRGKAAADRSLRFDQQITTRALTDTYRKALEARRGRSGHGSRWSREPAR